MTISLALTWANYWALVAGFFTGTLLQTNANYFIHPYGPWLSLRAWRDIAGFSGLDLAAGYGADGALSRHRHDRR